jgi:preprotein translocase subunit SecA
LKEEMNLDISKEELQGLEYNELKEKIVEKIEQEYEKKMSVLVPEQRSEFERIIYLQILDNAWREHLYQMDILKTGIGLRGYNQKDPLTEYKKESYNLFVELVNRIKYEAVKTLQLVQFQEEKDEEEEKLKKMLQELEAEAMSDIKLEHESVLEPKEKEEKPVLKKKIPRNAPCPCGSGKKYKYCCGKSGPKKGVLAKKEV